MKINTFRKTVLTLLFFTLLPLLLISLIIYLFVSYNLETQVKKNELQNLEIYKNKIEINLDSINSISIQQAMVASSYPFNDFFAQSVTEIKKLLNSNSASLLSNEYINDVYVYMNDQALVIDNGILFHWDDFSDQSWLGLFETAKNSKSSPSPVWLYNRAILKTSMDSSTNGEKASGARPTGAKYASSLIRPYPFTVNKNEGFIVINFDMQKLLKDSVGTKQNTYAVLSPENKLIFSTDSNLEYPFLNVKNNKVRINGKDYYVFTLKSDLYGFQYVSLMDKETLLAPIAPVKDIIYCIVILGIASMILSAVFTSRILYKPVSNLVNYIDQVHHNIGSTPIANEFIFIRTSFDNLLEKNNNMNVELSRSSDIVRETMVLKILRGDLAASEYMETCRLSEIQGREFVVLSAEIYDGNEIPYDFLLKELQHEFASQSESLKIFSAKLSNRMAGFLFCFSNANKFQETRSFFLSSSIKEICWENGIAMGVGNPTDLISNVNASFLQSLSAIKYRLFRKDSPVIFYEALPLGEKSSALHTLVDYEHKLVNLVKENKASQINVSIKEMLSFASSSNISPDSAYNWLNQLRDTLFAIPDSIGFDSREILGDDYEQLLQEYRTLKNMDSLQEYLNRLSLRIICGLNNKRSGKNQEIIQAVKQYVMSNISEDTSLSSIADRFSISAPYFSNLFKNETGENFINYVIRLKIETAKGLLRDTNLSVEDISRKVGYFNNHGFYSTFKKNTGFTPNEYRKTARINVSSDLGSAALLK